MNSNGLLCAAISLVTFWGGVALILESVADAIASPRSLPLHVNAVAVLIGSAFVALGWWMYKRGERQELNRWAKHQQELDELRQRPKG